MPKKKKKNRKNKVKKLQPLSLREVTDAVCKIKSANLHELDMLSAPMVEKQPHLCGTVVGLKLDGVTPPLKEVSTISIPRSGTTVKLKPEPLLTSMILMPRPLPSSSDDKRQLASCALFAEYFLNSSRLIL